MTRQQELTEQVNRITLEMIKNHNTPVRMIVAELCFNLAESQFTWAWSKHKVPAGLETKFINDLGLSKCRKTEATYCLMIGEQTENGCFIIGKYKNVWLKDLTHQ